MVFWIVVIGEFNVGKSILINVLLGYKILFISIKLRMVVKIIFWYSEEDVYYVIYNIKYEYLNFDEIIYIENFV